MNIPVEELVQVLVAFVAGAILGLERETHGKPAGLRTMILITVGSTIFSILSLSVLNSTYDRIASNIVTGVGFVGGGVIFKEGVNMKGITTAATIWVAAAIGMAIGFHQYWLAAVSVVMVMVALLCLSMLEEKLETERLNRVYKVSFAKKDYDAEKLKAALTNLNVKVTIKKLMKNEDIITVFYLVKVRKQDPHKVDDFLLADPAIKSFEV